MTPVWRVVRVLMFAAVALVQPALTRAQGTVADYQRANSVNQRLNNLVLNQPTDPTWLGNTNRMWYRVTVEGGTEYRLVDAAAAQQGPLFDHARLASALSSATGNSYTAVTLPFALPAARLTVSDDVSTIRFVIGENWWSCALAAYTCTRGEAAPPAPAGRGGGAGGGGQGQQNQPRVSPDSTWEGSSRITTSPSGRIGGTRRPAAARVVAARAVVVRVAAVPRRRAMSSC